MAAWHYSNLAYALLGLVVARISGTPFRDYVQERLLGPLGLERTTWGPGDGAALPYFVEPYSDAVRREPVLELGGKGGESGPLQHGRRPRPLGRVPLRPGRVGARPPRRSAEMHDLNVMADADWTRGWGLGLELWRRGERIFGGHTGGFPGFLSILAYSRRDRVGAVVLTNAATGRSSSPTGLELAEAALEELAPELEPWTPEEAPPAEIAPLLGRWWSEGDESIFSWRARQARGAARGLRRPSASRRCSSREGDDRFRVVSGRERGETLRVVRDESGEVVKLYWATYPFTRTPEVFGPTA